MSNSVSSESTKRHLNPLTSRKRGGDDEEDEDDEGIIDLPPIDSSATLTTVSTVLATTDQFMHTSQFRIHFVESVRVQTLMALRVATKGWKATTDALIDEGLVPSNIDVNDSDAVVAHLRSKQS
ncbi:hypothetical protein TrLO_g9307 [Triparma laevis f. longispina]|uniref:Uncharacterized protein n=1 Tax=Triparma laevis f. longispina TaxID=1714387 RepID=A0A9W7FF54_9STRA|nr:hypothetical protein TrLO_g9307 [Triparma laevis f. longispina]